MMIMFCPRCGKEIEVSNESRFCSGCGLEFSWQPAPTVAPITATNPTPQTPRTPEMSHEMKDRNVIKPIPYGNNDNPDAVLKKIGTRIDNEEKSLRNFSNGCLIALIVMLGICAAPFIIAIILFIL